MFAKHTPALLSDGQPTYSVETSGKGKTARRTLVLRIPLADSADSLEPSASGKSRIVCSTHGNQRLGDVTIDGKPLTLGLNAYIKS